MAPPGTLHAFQVGQTLIRMSMSAFASARLYSSAEETLMQAGNRVKYTKACRIMPE